MREVIIINRVYEKIGWIDKLNFINTETQMPIQLKVYNGCLKLIDKDIMVGYSTFKKKSKECKIVIEQNLPF